MANRHDGNDGNSSLFGRRSYLQMLGGATGIAALTGTSLAQSASPDTDSVVDLGEQGLSNGDVIDDYLDSYFESGVEVRVPEGEYEYHGSGFGGTYSDAALVGQGEVVLSNEAGTYRETIEAESGVVAIRNLTLRGKSGPDKTRFRLEAQDAGHVLIDNFNLPDGVVDPGDARGFYVPSGHAGVVEIRNSYIANMSNNGIYASSPGKGADGRVIVENCFLHNNNITGIRLGSSDSVARNCLVLNDGSPPVIYDGGSVNMRGIRVSEVGEEISIENCEVVHSYEGAGAPIELHRDAEGGSGTIQNVRLRNETSTPAINEKGDTATGWSTTDVSISGDGNLDYPSNFDGVCVGDECDSPSGDDPQNEDTSTDDGTTDAETTDDGTTDAETTDDGSTDDGADDSTGTGTSRTELSIVTDESDGINYEFTTTGEIEPMYERDRYNANLAEPVDEASENDDGTWTATGSTGGASHSGDSFLYEGDMIDFSATGDVDAMTLYADGIEVTVDDLLVAEETDDGTADAETTDDGTTDVETTDDGTADDGTTDDGTTDDSTESTVKKSIILDGTDSGGVTTYAFRVTGEVERDDAVSTAPNGNRWDEMEDTVDESSVTGIIGRGIDGYRYTGNLVAIEFDGAANVTVDDY